MGDIAIRVEHLSKRYRIGRRERYHTLRDTLTDALSAPFRRLKATVPPSSPPSSQSPNGDNIIWALKDISFEVKQGEVVGVIGRNGAGKSTLLKILSRITKPTAGRAQIYGRVGSLLEVGTGFHPELTGRENIYLNGAILGMKKVEIDRKFDEIVAFAEVEKFIDTPVKYYSSGMYVRLAFAVAAHLEPEILLVDEVLAVGDVAFQKKCLGKMGDVAKEGRTVLFVSHNMQAIALLCGEAIWLQNGQVTGRGPSRHIVERYLSLGSHKSAEAIWAFKDAPSSDLVKLHAVKVCGTNGQASFDQHCGAPITLSMEFWCLRQTEVTPSFHIYNQSGILLFPTANLHTNGWNQRVYQPGLYRCSCIIPAPLLNAGTYFVHAFLSRDTDGMPYVHVPEVVSFQVIDDGTGRGNYIGEYYPGLIRPLLSWTGERLADLPFLYAQQSMR
jgi:lipopolysaccharide transport system ATP-binding protein